MIIPSRRRALARAAFAVAVLAGAAIAGAFSAWRYHTLGLTLSHYDARGHLVVARRIFDSLTPGWQQIGAVWLPLPHLLNALPVQIDFFYRTGASAVVLSILCYAAATAAIAWIITTFSGSRLAGLAGALVFAANPNVLYLQSTPMTEPLLIATLAVALALLVEWTETDVRAPLAGVAFALACLTRYEAWPVTGSALVVAVGARWRRDGSFQGAVRSVARIAVVPALTIVAFLVFSRIVVGAWFVNDFFVPENDAQGHPSAVLSEIIWGVHALSGSGVLAAAVLGIVAIGVLVWRSGGGLAPLLPLTLATSAAVPFLAFLEGHPYRIRYMVPLLAVQAVLAGMATAIVPRLRTVAALALVVLCAVELHPLDTSAAMVKEAQWDRPSSRQREAVSRCLADAYDGQTVMASMGSLGHYMQELSARGFALHDFLHEGNGDIWLNALMGPRAFVGWMLIEEKAEGGDMLAKIARENPSFLEGFSRVCDGAGVALYRRNADAQSTLVRSAR